MHTLLKLQIVVASLTTIGVWSNLFVNYQNKVLNNPSKPIEKGQ